MKDIICILTNSGELDFEVLFCKMAILTLLLFLVLGIGAVAFIIRKTEEGDGKRWNEFCRLVFECAKKVYSLNALVALLMVCVIFLVAYNIKIGITDVNLTVLTISFALASIIPYIIGRSIAKDKVDSIVEKKFEERFKNLTRNYSNSLFTLTKNNAHTRRIAADLLRLKKDPLYDEWALGWAAEAIVGYTLIHNKYDKSEKYATECMQIMKDVFANSNFSVKPDDAENKDIHARTLKSLLSMHAVVNMYAFNKIKIGDEGINDYKELIELEKKLFEWDGSLDKGSIASSCKVADFSKEDNEDLKKNIESYITNKLKH